MTTASAHGRVNLIGAHTDYNEGFVLPAPIPQRAHVELRLRGDDQVLVWSREMDEWVEYRLGEEHPRQEWIDYVMGCTAALREAGHPIHGGEIRIRSDVPLGGGLSSSAALEVALLRVLRSAYKLPIDDVEIALLGQRAEVQFVGATTGAMDRLVASLGHPGAALFIDLRSLTIKSVPLSAGEVIVVHSGISHDHAKGDVRTRQVECAEAARRLGVPALRDVGLIDLPAVARLPAPLDRRARHVITENARVLDAVSALEHKDLDWFGELLNASHASMRDDFDASLPAIDELVRIASADPDVYGARLTGGGFGGAIVAIGQRGTGERIARRVASRYAAITHHTPHIVVAGDSSRS